MGDMSIGNVRIPPEQCSAKITGGATRFRLILIIIIIMSQFLPRKIKKILRYFLIMTGAR